LKKSETQIPRGLKSVRENPVVPGGLGYIFHSTPALPRWAIVVSPCGLRFRYLQGSNLPPQSDKSGSHAKDRSVQSNTWSEPPQRL